MFIAVAIIISLSLSLLTWSDLPTVGVTESGQCVYIETGPDFKRKSCPKILPTKYHMIYVSDLR